MRIYDIILKKRNNSKLSKEEINFFISEYTNGKIPDYQVSALLMAIYFNGMDDEETSNLTLCMANSGDTVDLSSIPGIKVDKHSTGGVGDKTTLIIGPLVAACGVPVAKMSGKGLGHTGGTIDKLESIPGFKTEVSQSDFINLVKSNGLSIVGQSGNLAPADKKIYALRDVTATVDSIPLIAASIMSKKIAAGSDCILLDVKVGSGAFMKTIDDAEELAKKMVSIGKIVGRRTLALITNMDIPLGYAIGNSLEVIESINTLKGNGPADLTEICIELSANMLHLAGKGSIERCKDLAKEAIASGEALRKFIKMVELQGGDISVITDTNNFSQSKIIHNVISRSSGYISSINTENCGMASMILGAGRRTKESSIDYSAGIVLNVKLGDYVKQGDIIARFHTSDICSISEAENLFFDSLTFSDHSPEIKPLIYSQIT